MKTAIIAIIAAVLGSCVTHYSDAVFVADVLRSDDLSLARNVEQANALLDMYERHQTTVQRDANGTETDTGLTGPGDRFIAALDEFSVYIVPVR